MINLIRRLFRRRWLQRRGRPLQMSLSINPATLAKISK
jgi:hypothetical protein